MQKEAARWDKLLGAGLLKPESIARLKGMLTDPTYKVKKWFDPFVDDPNNTQGLSANLIDRLRVKTPTSEGIRALTGITQEPHAGSTLGKFRFGLHHGNNSPNSFNFKNLREMLPSLREDHAMLTPNATNIFFGASNPFRGALEALKVKFPRLFPAALFKPAKPVTEMLWPDLGMNSNYGKWINGPNGSVGSYGPNGNIVAGDSRTLTHELGHRADFNRPFSDFLKDRIETIKHFNKTYPEVGARLQQDLGFAQPGTTQDKILNEAIGHRNALSGWGGNALRKVYDDAPVRFPWMNDTLAKAQPGSVDEGVLKHLFSSYGSFFKEQ